MIEEMLRDSRILIIDDEQVHADLLIRVLKEQGYRHFYSATDPRQTIELFRDFKPDLIILDWRMPGLGGAQVLNQLRELIAPETYLPILVVTAAPELEIRRQALAGGASDFLSKPFDPSEIVLRVDNLARARLLHCRSVENEQRLRALFENVLDAIVVADDNGRYVDANPAACALFGYSREEILKLSIADITPPANLGIKERLWKEFVAAGKQSGEFTILRKGGMLGEVEFRATAHFLPGLHLSVMRDVTRRKQAEAEHRQAEEALREREARIRSMLDSALDGFIAMDHAGRVVEFNPAAERMFGYRREEVIGREMAEMIIPTSLRERHHKGMAHYRATGVGPVLNQRIEIAAMRADGSEFPVELSIVRVPRDGPPLFAGYLHEISNRKQIQAALIESEGRLREVLDTLPAATYTCDADGLITYFNERAAELWGRSPKLNDPEDRFCGSFRLRRPDTTSIPRDQCPVAAAVKEGRIVTGNEIIVERPDGAHMFALAYAKPLLNSSGGVTGAVNVLIDITARKRTETALQEAKAEAEIANRAKSEFLSRMSHELRTPLNAILGFAQILEMNGLDGQPRDCVAHILKAGTHLLGLINEVLDLSGIEAGRVTFSIEAVPVHEILLECVELIRPLADARDLRLVLPKKDAQELHVLADSQRLKQVFLNLLANAVKYNRQGGAVTVSLEELPAKRLRIIVEDTGDGIAPENIDHLFFPFERLGAAREGVEGTGLGLALSKRLIEAMGGEIGVKSRIGCGSAFWVKLPRSPNPMRPALAPGAPTETAALSAGTVLYIEDNLSNLTLIEYLFSTRPKYKLLAAMQGRLGIDLARQHRPALILLDMHLPDIMGDKVLAILKGDPATSSIPVAILTADATSHQEARLLAAGADYYLTKPVDVPRLLRLIEQTLALPTDVDCKT